MSGHGASGWDRTPDDVEVGLTDAERRLVDLIGDCFREFTELPEYHPAAHPHRFQPGGPPERRPPG